MKYRQRPRFVEAMQLTETNHQEVVTWADSLAKAAGLNDSGVTAFPEDNRCLLLSRGYPTDDDFAEPGEYIVLGQPGYFYPVSAKAFEATYSPERKCRSCCRTMLGSTHDTCKCGWRWFESPFGPEDDEPTGLGF